MCLELKEAHYEMKKEILGFISEWDEYGEAVIPAVIQSAVYDYEKWLTQLYDLKKCETCPDNLVSASTYFLVVEDRVIGAINIRYSLNEYLLKFGGHISYGVRPTERKKGYASLMLKQAILIIKEVGIEKVLVTCDKNNIASSKTIIKNGGILENEVLEDKGIVQRYWIKT